MLDLLRGVKGHPSHPPLTDAAMAFFTAASVLTIVGFFDFHQSAFASAALFLTALGILAALVTMLTGYLDYRLIAKGGALHKTAMIHGSIMFVTTLIYLALFFTLRNDTQGVNDLSTASFVLAIIAMLFMSIGGYLGGTLTYSYGMRVENKDLEVKDAVTPQLDDTPNRPK